MMPRDVIIFDIETKKEFAEVGGRGRPELLGVSVLGAYSYNADRYSVFEEHELKQFEEMLASTGLLIGFNIRSFDIPVLQPYLTLDLKTIPALDMMDAVIAALGFRVSLDNLAKTTVNAAKSADGLQALRWFREGRIQEVKDYCLKDVEVTRKLYEHGKATGRMQCILREAIEPRTIAVDWAGYRPQESPEDRQPRLI